MPNGCNRIGTLLLGLLLLLAGAANAEGPRKAKSQAKPVLPEVAKRLGLRGVVRLEIEIAADGTVKSAKALGGHPVLIQSAEQAVLKWRYQPGPSTREIVEFDFKQGN